MNELKSDEKEMSKTRANYFMSLSANGRIIKKCVDIKDHSYKKLYFKSNIEDFWIMNGDKSNLYDIVKKNDSIVKNKGSMDLYIYFGDTHKDTVMSIIYKYKN